MLESAALGPDIAEALAEISWYKRLDYWPQCKDPSSSFEWSDIIYDITILNKSSQYEFKCIHLLNRRITCGFSKDHILPYCVAFFSWVCSQRITATFVNGCHWCWYLCFEERKCWRQGVQSWLPLTWTQSVRCWRDMLEKWTMEDKKKKKTRNKEQQPSKRLHAVSEIYMITYKLIQ